MSGVYLTVWDDVSQFDQVLRPTMGGWPHITLAYTGKSLSIDELKSVAKEAFDYWAMQPIILKSAKVNSFFHERMGMERHDVLVEIHEEKSVEKSRDNLLRNVFPHRSNNFAMHKPHVTVLTCWSKAEAEARCEEVNTLLPRQVKVTGVTID